MFRRYLLFLFLPLSVVVLGGGLLLVNSAGWTPARYHDTVEFIDHKLSLAARIEGPKIVIVSGSNAHYSLSAEHLSTVAERPAFNFGVRAGLGIDYTLFEARKILRPGDIVILPLELEHYAGNDILNRLAVSVSLSQGFDYFQSLAWGDRLTYIRHVPRSRLWRSVRALWTGNRPGSSSIAEGINTFGDETRHTPDDGSRARLAAALSQHYHYPPPDAESSSVASIDRFLDWARAHDITVFAAWPSLAVHPDLQGPSFDELVARIEAFWAGRGIPLIGKIGDSQFPEQLMYDSVYHSNKAGRERRMARFIPDFCAASHLCQARKEGKTP